MMRDDPSLYKPGTYGCHEAMHMAMVLANAVDEQLAEHPAIMMNPRWLAMAVRAREVLLDLYQAIGSEHLWAADAEKRSATIVLSPTDQPVADPS